MVENQAKRQAEWLYEVLYKQIHWQKKRAGLKEQSQSFQFKKMN
jgi:hypothetical protein